MKKTWMIALIIIGVFSGSLSAQAAIKIPAVYIALGDSLAAGQTPNSEIDTGYADLIAQELSRHQPVALYTKQLAFPGFTTKDVLERIQSKEAQQTLASANIITLSAGANDLLRLIQSDPEVGALAFQQIQVDFALNSARINMETILDELKKRAPNADVYVMGYYFAYPHVRESQKEGTAKQLDRLNEILKRSSEKAGATFVSVDKSFGEKAIDKVPNQRDVHPNLKGYQAMANSFLDQYQKGWTVEKGELPKPNPLSFEEVMKIQEDQKAADGEASARPSQKMAADYLAIREPIPYV